MIQCPWIGDGIYSIRVKAKFCSLHHSEVYIVFTFCRYSTSTLHPTRRTKVVLKGMQKKRTGNHCSGDINLHFVHYFIQAAEKLLVLHSFSIEISNLHIAESYSQFLHSYIIKLIPVVK